MGESERDLFPAIPIGQLFFNKGKVCPWGGPLAEALEQGRLHVWNQDLLPLADQLLVLGPDKDVMGALRREGMALILENLLHGIIGGGILREIIRRLQCPFFLVHHGDQHRSKFIRYILVGTEGMIPLGQQDPGDLMEDGKGERVLGLFIVFDKGMEVVDILGTKNHS